MLDGGGRAVAAALACALAAIVGACASDEPASALTNGNGKAAPTVIDGASTKLTDDEAIAWLQQECKDCHGIDPATGTKAAYYSAWPMPAEGVTRSWLEVSELTANAYQTIRHAALGKGESPAMMPPVVSETKKPALPKIIDWFQRKVPYAVIDADARYGNDKANVEKGLMEFTCSKPASLRTYLSRVTFGAFDRPPTTTETGWFSAAELSAPVTKAQRELVVSKLNDVWKPELLDIGLRKLAAVVGGGPGIPNGIFDQFIVADLREELYRSFLTRYETATWQDYFTANTVMVSPATAPLYGCVPGSDWHECTMQAPRSGFFSTIGFLASRPQSFLVESNNHGRVASLFFTLYGEQLLAATDGPIGEATPPLPNCLETTDTRAYKNAPRGSAAVPSFGKVCQSCHVSRYMAAGSMLFRPFSTTGLVYKTDTFGLEGSPDQLLVSAAIDPSWTVPALGSTENGAPVTVSFLKALLDSNPKPCIATGKAANPYVNVGSVGELAQQLIQNRSSFARGFIRHAHRAFSNLTSINLEMSLRGLDAFESGSQKLPDLVKTYFLTDTLACEVPE